MMKHNEKEIKELAFLSAMEWKRPECVNDVCWNFVLVLLMRIPWKKSDISCRNLSHQLWWLWCLLHGSVVDFEFLLFSTAFERLHEKSWFCSFASKFILERSISLLKVINRNFLKWIQLVRINFVVVNNNFLLHNFSRFPLFFYFFKLSSLTYPCFSYRLWF